MGYPLAPHQRRAIEFFDTHESGLLIYEAGTGKTICALAWIHSALVRGIISNALILCPAMLVPRWWAEVEKMRDFEDYTDFDVELVRDALTVWSLSSTWESHKTMINHRDGTQSIKRTVQLRPALKRTYDAVFVDESHRLGSPTTNVTKSCIALSRAIPRRFCMTGTPDVGEYTKLYGQLMFINPGMWRSFSEFKSRYVLQYDHFRNPKLYDVEACEALKRKYGIVARLSECFDMPSKIDTLVPCPIASIKAYKDVLAGRVSQYGLTVTASGVLPLKTLQLVSGHIKGDTCTHRVETSKVRVLEDLLGGYDGKVVIVCKYRESIDMVSEALKTVDMTFHTFHGDTHEPTWQTFQNDRSRAIIVQYQKAIGIDLYASCLMILYEPTFSALELEQTRKRIWRKGQDRPCRYYYLYTPGTLEERCWNSVRNGVDVSSEMLEEWARESNK